MLCGCFLFLDELFFLKANSKSYIKLMLCDDDAYLEVQVSFSHA